MDRPGAGIVAVVDDDAALRETMKLMLEVAGYEVMSFAAAEELVRVVERDDIACLILDHTLPGISGLEFLKRSGDLRTHEIILLTAYGTVPTALDAVRSGAFEFVEKPFDPPELLSIVARAVAAAGERRRRRMEEQAKRARLASLTVREAETLAFLLRGSATKTIAAALKISPRTVEIHRGRVMEKLACHGPVELYREYRELVGFTEADQA